MTCVFIASGVQLSSILSESRENISLHQCFVQYRFQSYNSSGLVSIIASSLLFNITDCKLSGYNYINNDYSGYISASVVHNCAISISNFVVCAQNISQIGKDSVPIMLNGSIVESCYFCDQLYVVYGICSQQLVFGSLLNGTSYCAYPFEFVNNECVCVEGYIINISTCINILNNFNVIKNETLAQQQQVLSIQTNLDQIKNDFLAISQIIESSVINNISVLEQKLQQHISNTTNQLSIQTNQLIQYSNELDQRIYNNITALNTTIRDINDTVENNMNNYNVIVKQMQNDITTLKQQIAKCSSSTDDENYTDSQNICTISLYIFRFNINSITHQLAKSNFSGGFVFGATQQISNAYIDIDDNIYQTIEPLFQNQVQFNNIIIQIGTQNTNSGQILTNSQSIVINQVKICSKTNTTIQVAANHQLNILQQQINDIRVVDLQISFGFVMSQGNICLIGVIKGTMNIVNYQVKGSYQSSGCVALAAMISQSSIINIHQLNFQPSSYNIGNESSYLISNSNSSQIYISNTTIVIGTIYTAAIFCQIATTSTNYLQFGGVISQINSTQLNVNNIIYDTKLQYVSQNIANSGLIIGNSFFSLNQININNICLQSIVNSVTQFLQYGLLGIFEGRLFIGASSIIIISSGTSTKFGTIGILTELCINAQISDVQIYFTVKNNVGSYNSPLIGYQKALNCSVINVSIYNSTMNSSLYCGSLFGVIIKNNITIISCSVVRSNMTCGSAVGGIVGVISCQSNTTIINQMINNCNFNSGDYAGAIVGTVGDIVDGSQNPFIFTKNITISNTNVISVLYAGGLIGMSRNNPQFQFDQLTINTIRVQGQYCGLFVGKLTTGSIVMTSSQSQGENYVNGIKYCKIPAKVALGNFSENPEGYLNWEPNQIISNRIQKVIKSNYIICSF
ncbi:Hypothetical_protein [Hexamita inflata]|uniref:Hypothetical_protein n=1 Tax=Hexamita inflata TaxID=28002 RepID=A0AA86NVB0_9EUKA|nr:Hypothetical protein HINF_LOCUS14515 [Hexamita inflata]